MGAGVATNPHFPRVENAVPVKACTSSLGGSGSDTSLAALANSLSGPSQALLPLGPLPSHRRISLPGQLPVCGSAARKLRSHWTVSESGSGTGFRPASRFFLARPAGRFHGVHPRGCRPPRLWQRPEASYRCRWTASGHEEKLSLFAESHKRKPPVDKMYNGDKCDRWGASQKAQAALPQGRSRYHLVMMYFVPASTGMPWWMLLSFPSPSSRRLFHARRLPARGVILILAFGKKV